MSGTPLWNFVTITETDSNVPFYKESPFSKLALYICITKSIPLTSKLTRNMDLPTDFPEDSDYEVSSTGTQEDNNYCYSLDFIKYLIVQVLRLV